MDYQVNVEGWKLWRDGGFDGAGCTGTGFCTGFGTGMGGNGGAMVGNLGHHGGMGMTGAMGSGGWRYRKLDMLLFEGPDGWILRIECYFSFYRLTEVEKLEVVVVALEGDALRWFQWENKWRPIRRWDELREFLLRQFRPSNGGSLCEQWLATSQTTSVTDYHRKFIEMVAPLDSLPKEIMLVQFLNGLRDDIRVEVRVLNPINLEQAMELASRVVVRNKVNNGKKTGFRVYKAGQY